MPEYNTEAVNELREYVKEHGTEGAEEIGLENPEEYLQVVEKIQEDGYDALSNEERELFAETTRNIYQTLDNKLERLDQVEEEYGPDKEPEKDISEIREEFEKDRKAFTSIPGIDEEDYESIHSIMELGEQLESSMGQIEEKNQQRREALEEAHDATAELMDEYDLRRD